ncbi:MAG: DUF4249 domain-containing protein [Fulvivirga sp.]|uniref:DUF4249 domain-containing protein n=1 Tax=Fulvivirga sp. TaxID=1931237 RepID=UPI0032EF5004
MNKRRVILFSYMLTLLVGCVDPIDFDVPPADEQIVIEGTISTDPGPYTVKVTKAIDLNEDTVRASPVVQMKIILHDDIGNSEDFVETMPGIYVTNGAMQGEVGRSYHITMETIDGKKYESEPDKLFPVGEITDIRYEYEARLKDEGFGEIPADVFNIYVDSEAGISDENYVRWKFTGLYKAETNPELKQEILPSYPIPRPLPLPCSGYVVLPGVGNRIGKVDECTCCTCYAYQYEEYPQLSDDQLVSGNQFNNIKVAEVPIDVGTFYEKYLVTIEQMSMTRNAFEFFRLVRSQKTNASSIFQPPSGEIRGNIKPANNNDTVIGLFWATSIKKKSTYIYREDVPYPLTEKFFVPDACYNFYPNSSTTQPAEWE